MKNSLTAAVACILMLCQTTLFAQAPDKRKVAFSCSCDDNVGARFATAVRDLMASSPRYRLGDFHSKATQWEVRAVSLDPSGKEDGIETALSVVIALEGFYETHYVQFCGVNKVADCAATAVATLDKQANK